MSLDLTCDSSGNDCLPTVIADEYWIKASAFLGGGRGYEGTVGGWVEGKGMVKK